MIFETKKKRYDIEDAKNKIVLLFDYEKMCSLIANTTYSRVFMTLKEVNVFRGLPFVERVMYRLNMAACYRKVIEIAGEKQAMFTAFQYLRDELHNSQTAKTSIYQIFDRKATEAFINIYFEQIKCYEDKEFWESKGDLSQFEYDGSDDECKETEVEIHTNSDPKSKNSTFLLSEEKIQELKSELQTIKNLLAAEILKRQSYKCDIRYNLHELRKVINV